MTDGLLVEVFWSSRELATVSLLAEVKGIMDNVVY